MDSKRERNPEVPRLSSLEPSTSGMVGLGGFEPPTSSLGIGAFLDKLSRINLFVLERVVLLRAGSGVEFTTQLATDSDCPRNYWCPTC